MNQDKTPLFSFLVNYIRNNPVQFHVPGHKKGVGMDREFFNFIGQNTLAIDLTAIEPLDDLNHPTKMIKEAQDLAAFAFKADYTYFSVQGTTTLIIAMIMSVCGPGDKLLVPRNVHKSVMSAIIFSGAIPIFIQPKFDVTLGVSHGISIETLREALDNHPDAKAVLFVNPTYFGFTTDLQQVVELVHGYNIPVLVDEAHGAHLYFHDDLPVSAMQAGADVAATSLHKLGGSLTQSSILNVKKGLVNVHRIQSILSMLTTTSTSYILLASLDVARKRLATEGNELLIKVLHFAKSAREQINQIDYLYCPGEETVILNNLSDYDPTKIVVSVKELGITGYAAEVWLRKKYNIEVELSDLFNIVCIITFGDTKKEVDLLILALNDLSQTFQSKNSTKGSITIDIPKIPSLAVSPHDAFYSEIETLSIEKTIGKIIAEFVMVYPPGIPIFVPGEIIDEENLSLIQRNVKAGLPIKGPKDKSIKTLCVVKES
ncbi:aminotransferase class I/II-fold pyridoxal phosphate-dependent enzyme [Bacillus thuringiensis]|uniref:aminotransferase class I/II-fold pyridoxal phosphate-dependent enzyme n=1 Tax=Bacillus thuringiensis TaxID=1428 RepID=UPI000E4B8AE3|nr:aminotransferase class I/II-fold pyridoxal phosphate-dependent enzyme [Bacillus thuringiensis]MDZ3952300.1 aminotransferase class I/II-fold pyridoxal phosphate-dependent enzyme [Bacillus thuringiensis]RGP53422.1 arginine decarboxylase [Bacillus thuringiensis]